MNRNSKTTVALAAALLALTACGKQEPRGDSDKVSSADMKREAREAANTTARYAQQEKDEFLRNAERELTATKANLEELKGRAQAATGEAKARLEFEIAALESKLRDAESKLADAKAAAGQAWDDAKQKFNQAMQDLKRSMEESRGKA